MAKLIKHRLDIKDYQEKLESQCQLVSFHLNGAIAEISDAKAYYKTPKVDENDAENIKIIDSADLSIECDNMIQLLKNIKTKFTKKD